MTTTMNTNTRQGGFTLLELLLVIGVAALLLIGGIATYRLVSDGNKTTESTRLLLTIRQQAQVMAQQQGGLYTGMNYDSAAGAAAADGGASPMVTSGTLRLNQRTPFNGVILTQPQTVNAIADSGLQVSFAGLPASACTKLFTAITNQDEVVSVTANGGTVRTAATAGAISATNAGADCNAAANTLVWILR